MSTAQRKLQVWPIVAGILVVGILLLTASDFLGAWVRDRLRTEQQVKVVEAVSPALEDYRREQADLLGNYDWVDQENGVVQIPIERAMELVAEEEGGEQ
jgi:type II secretory pathway pseudopilin PulG